MSQMNHGEAGTAVLPKTTVESKVKLRLDTPPWWQWINILSLDAVGVAVVWQNLFAEAYRVRIGAGIPLVLACSVWVIYTVDHLLDTGDFSASCEPARKLFLRRCRGVMGGVSITSMLLTFLFAYLFVSRSIFQAGLVCGGLVLSYLVAVHLVFAKSRLLWPRQVAVAVLFSTGVAMPVWLQGGLNRVNFAAATFLFLVLCWLNCCAVEVWEWLPASQSGLEMPDKWARSTASHLRLYAGMLIGVACWLGWWSVIGSQIELSVLLSAAAFIAIASWRKADTGASRTALSCTLLDLALLSPLLVIF